MRVGWTEYLRPTDALVTCGVIDEWCSYLEEATSLVAINQFLFWLQRYFLHHFYKNSDGRANKSPDSEYEDDNDYEDDHDDDNNLIVKRFDFEARNRSLVSPTPASSKDQRRRRNDQPHEIENRVSLSAKIVGRWKELNEL